MNFWVRHPPRWSLLHSLGEENSKCLKYSGLYCRWNKLQFITKYNSSSFSALILWEERRRRRRRRLLTLFLFAFCGQAFPQEPHSSRDRVASASVKYLYKPRRV